MADLLEKAAVLALVRVTNENWYLTADLIEKVGSALQFIQGDWSGLEPSDIVEAERLSAQLTQSAIDHYAEMIVRLERDGIRTVTVLDDDYPANLRDVYNRPPMLFVKGEVLDQDECSVAVVGTRTPSHAGIKAARHLASELAGRGITVLSGLARGIDTAAHEAALETGGRTIAVLGTGIHRVYPPENASLAREIERRGALVSQFWPDAPPTRYSFPLRNIVMSGLAIGTVVVEAGPTSGAKLQARFALEHGKRLFLIQSLVSKQLWAQRFAQLPATTVVGSADEILPHVEALARPGQEVSVS